MAKICEPCGFYSTENAPTTCPQCGQGLRMTMLPPQGQEAAPLALGGSAATTATARARHRKEGFLDGMGIDPKYVGFAAFILVGIIGFSVRQYAKREQIQQVEPGMHISQAVWLLDSGRDRSHPRMVRLRDRFAEDDDSTGKIDHRDAGIHIVIHWEKGIVTKVENKEGGGGMRRTQTTITHPGSRRGGGDDDDDDVDDDWQ